MVVDLRRCIGCRACMVACKAENNTGGGMFWMYVFRREVGRYPNVTRRFLPRPCMHCRSPSCAEACPTQARHKNEADGLVLTNYSKCIGCRYCVVACPYNVNYFNWREPKKNQYFEWGVEGRGMYGKGGVMEYVADTIPPNLNPDVARRDIPTLQYRFVGVVEKCTFCAHRIWSGIKKGLRPGVDRDATPACVITCPVKALHFGDLDDPDSNVSRLLAKRMWQRALEELGNEPSVYYLF
jgi:Fe-S-cluster-containing dehydrogenase component